MSALNKTAAEVISEIKMLRAANPNLSFLLVEGSDDVKFWLPRVALSCGVILATCKSVGKTAVRGLNKRGFIGHVGVFDRDYDDIYSSSSWQANELYWDAHSIETILFFSDAFEKTMGELAVLSKRQSFETSLGIPTSTYVAGICVEIGKLRWLAALQGIAIEASALSPYRFVSDATFAFDINLANQQAVIYGLAPSLLQLPGKLAQLPTVDRRLIMRGHDLSAIVAIGLRKVLGSGASLGDVESHLRSGFEEKHLQLTDVYSILRLWEQNRVPYVILK